MASFKATRYKGKCKQFNAEKGFGFIAVNDGSGDVFVHQSEVYANGYRTLQKGEHLEFEIVHQQNGKRKAVNVSGPNGAFVKGFNNMNNKATHKNVSNERNKAKQRAMEYLFNNKHLTMMSERGRCVWNFGFGANINPWKLEKKRGIRPIGKKLRGKLVGWRLLFDHKGGFGNLINVKTESKGVNVTKFEPFIDGKDYEVHGVLLKLSHSDFIKLAQMESRYDLHQVKVQIYANDVIDGGCGDVNAIIFKSPKHHRTKTSNLLPTKRYIDLIQRGAESMNLTDKYCKWLRRIRGIDSKSRGNEYY